MAKMQPFWWFLSPNRIEFDEPLDDGYFKNKGEIWLASVSSGYIDDEGEVWLAKFLNDEVEPYGGSYFDRV